MRPSLISSPFLERLTAAHVDSHDRLCVHVHLRLRHDVGSVSVPPLSSFFVRPDRLTDGTWLTGCSGVWILIGETFPTRTRAKQGAIATASNWLWNFLLAFFTPFITRNIQFRYGFVFAGACAVYFIDSAC